MCVAIPGKIIERHDDAAVVDCQGNRVPITATLTPLANVGDWVLVHAGFSISTLDECDALETWSYLNDMRNELELSSPIEPNGHSP